MGRNDLEVYLTYDYQSMYNYDRKARLAIETIMERLMKYCKDGDDTMQIR